MSYRSFTERMKIKINGFFGPLPDPDKWVFIVGCYNSGTTLLHDLLSLQSDVGVLPDEGQFFTDQFLLPKEQNLPRLWAIEPDKFYLDEYDQNGPNPVKLKKQWGSLYNDIDKKVLLEKSPTNAARTRWLQKHFKNAYFIGIIRNGYAVAEGIRRKAGHSIDVCARQWYESNKIMINDFKHLDNKMLIRYEELTGNLQAQYDKILKFIGLKNHSVELENLKLSIHERFSEVRDMNPHSFKNLDNDDMKIINAIAGNLMEEFGYPVVKGV